MDVVIPISRMINNPLEPEHIFSYSAGSVHNKIASISASIIYHPPLGKTPCPQGDN